MVALFKNKFKNYLNPQRHRNQIKTARFDMWFYCKSGTKRHSSPGQALKYGNSKIIIFRCSPHLESGFGIATNLFNFDRLAKIIFGSNFKATAQMIQGGGKGGDRCSFEWILLIRKPKKHNFRTKSSAL